MFDLNKLIDVAKKVRENSYSPYSNYKVGCALLTKNGKIFSGCNIENAGIMSICAERVAFTKAISEGEKDFEALLVLGGSENLISTSPCGYCRQFMSEFVDNNFKIYALGPNNKITPYSMQDLLPHNFSL